MGAWWSTWWVREDRGGIPDPVTGLTVAQVEAVRKTFAMVRGDPKVLGVDLFMSLFEAHPEYQREFKSFATIKRQNLPDSKRFQAHATTVAYSIMILVDNLHDSECLLELLLRIGQNHGRRNIQEEAFENLKATIMSLLRRKLQGRLTPFAEASWSKTLSVANSVIYKGLEEGKKEVVASSGSQSH